MKILECIPNFSEGQRPEVIKAIAEAVMSVEGVTLLHIDSGFTTNRSVMTFVGAPDDVVEAAFRAIKTAAELIDMSVQKGAHPRIGATDVCPLVPIAGISVEEAVAYSKRLAERVGALGIPVYLYEYSAKNKIRRNLANIRAGEYEALPQRIISEDWTPDLGPKIFNPKTGATVIGARDFLVAYNINLNTKSESIAWDIAFEVRQRGGVQKNAAGEIITDKEGAPIRVPGKLKAVKAIAWFIEEFAAAQVSMNLVDLNTTPVHIAYEAVRNGAEKRGYKVTASELIGLIPLQTMLQAGRYFHIKKGIDTAEDELIQTAIKGLQLDKIKPFDPHERIIEYRMREKAHFSIEMLTLKK